MCTLYWFLLQKHNFCKNVKIQKQCILKQLLSQIEIITSIRLTHVDCKFTSIYSCKCYVKLIKKVKHIVTIFNVKFFVDICKRQWQCLYLPWLLGKSGKNECFLLVIVIMPKVPRQKQPLLAFFLNDNLQVWMLI